MSKKWGTEPGMSQNNRDVMIYCPVLQEKEYSNSAYNQETDQN